MFYIGNEHKIPLIPNIDVLATQIGSSFTAHVGDNVNKIQFEAWVIEEIAVLNLTITFSIGQKS